jgi:hypothetical protein
MPSDEYQSTPAEVRKFALLQIGLTAVFLVVFFFMLGGSDAPYPPVWMAVLLVALERADLRGFALVHPSYDPGRPPRPPPPPTTRHWASSPHRRSASSRTARLPCWRP